VIPRRPAALARRRRPSSATERWTSRLPARPAAPHAAAAPRWLVAASVAACLAYVVLRYVVVKSPPEKLQHLPLFLGNKAIAMWALLALAGAKLRPGAAWARAARRGGATAAALHVLASFALLGPGYFPAMYDPESWPWRMRASAELAVLAGAAALVAYGSLVLRRRAAAARPRAALVSSAALLAVVLHCVALGAYQWATPSVWPGGVMPPVTLLCAALGAAGVVAAALRALRARRG
jgi:hypothetical protein